MMDARKAAALFVAFSSYKDSHAGRPSVREAAQFARERWETFLPGAHEGFGRLLLKIAQRPAAASRTTIKYLRND